MRGTWLKFFLNQSCARVLLSIIPLVYCLCIYLLYIIIIRIQKRSYNQARLDPVHTYLLCDHSAVN